MQYLIFMLPAIVFQLSFCCVAHLYILIIAHQRTKVQVCDATYDAMKYKSRVHKKISVNEKLSFIKGSLFFAVALIFAVIIFLR